MMNRERAMPLLVPVAGAAVITLLLMLQPSGILESYDLPRMHQCYKHDLRAMVLAGEWPWWNPYTALGRPFFADVETGTLYPPSWLVVVLGVPAGIIAMVGLHLGLAIAGTRRLASRLGVTEPYASAAGIFFALSGALLARIESGQLHVFAVACLWPFLFDSFLQLKNPGNRPVVRAALWGALALLAGSPAMLWCGLVALVPLVLGTETSWRSAGRTLVRCAGALALAAALAGVQLLPFVELVQQGNRPLHDSAFATTGGITGQDWLSLLLPPGAWLPVNWEFNLHVSAVFVILASLAALKAAKRPEVRALVLMGLCGVVLSLGDQTPALPALAEWLPGFAGVRYPGRYGLMSALAIVLLACWWLSQQAGRPNKRPIVARVLLALQLVIAVVGIFSQGFLYRAPAAALHDAAIQADLKTENLPRDNAPPRSALPISLQRANAGFQSGTSTVSGFNNPALARTWHTLYLLARETEPNFHRAEILDEILFQAATHARYLGLSVTTRQNDLAVIYHAPAGPRAFLSFQPQTVGHWREAVEKIRTGHDFVASALVETPPAGLGATAGTGSAHITAFERNRVTVDVDADRPALLVLAEAWYPGWRATVDGKDAAVVPANAWMRAVAVPAGQHTVIFHYRPRWLPVGLALTLAASLAAWLLWRHSPSTHAPTHAP
jgi:hypothetical protein